ncbi:hypothetical protein PROVRUST_05071 [Providencia rustigianii DSM 4541]|uniref:Uncharacterized protein n=1 Tax=Providencia rustigianii DSM 4541 TaxID=500637 RepID=D1NZA1_9GAMM|nr:hypothetical protein PROVRUST_05071 [Providencia rustigianii DSM 4541]
MPNVNVLLWHEIAAISGQLCDVSHQISAINSVVFLDGAKQCSMRMGFRCKKPTKKVG